MTAPAQDDDRDGVAEAMGGIGDDPQPGDTTDTGSAPAGAEGSELAEQIADAVEGDGGSMPG